MSFNPRTIACGLPRSPLSSNEMLWFQVINEDNPEGLQIPKMDLTKSGKSEIPRVCYLRVSESSEPDLGSDYTRTC